MPFCFLSCLFKVKYYHLRINKATYPVLSKTHASPVSLDLFFNILNFVFCPVQQQMVIFDFKEEGTGTEDVAIAHCHLVYFLGCNIPAKFQ